VVGANSPLDFPRLIPDTRYSSSTYGRWFSNPIDGGGRFGPISEIVMRDIDWSQLFNYYIEYENTKQTTIQR
jgi:hypothetical protein